MVLQIFKLTADGYCCRRMFRQHCNVSLFGFNGFDLIEFDRLAIGSHKGAAR